MVERNLVTLEDYIRTFLIEDNSLKAAVKVATKLIQFTISERTGITHFQKHLGRTVSEKEAIERISACLSFAISY